MSGIVLKVFRISVILVFFQSFGSDFGILPGVSYGYKYAAHRPLRIHPHFASLKQELDKEEVSLLEDVVWNVVLYVKRLLSVVPEAGETLLLKRNACKSSWLEGRNAGKCASIRKDYVGETCLDNFLIPDIHLEAFYTWTNNPLPDKTWYTDGNGVPHSDFILYVRASTTKACLTNFQQDVSYEIISYAKYCKLGKNERPIAGYINFCPSQFRKYKNERGKLVLTALHELFHTLGFSKDLIPKFRDCSHRNATGDCPIWGFPTLRKQDSNYVLFTPAVVKEMQNHFACTRPEFGAPMPVKNQVLQSHWNASVLRGSIMTSKLGNPEETFVDPITLALFADTGWYQVNMAVADSYQYGKGSGCDSGLGYQSNIPIQSCFQSLSQETTCDRLNHKTIVNCTGAGDNQYTAKQHIVADCDIYMESVNGPLQQDEDSYCLLQMSQNNTQGKCYVIKCLPNGDIWVKNEDTNWLNCPLGESLDIPYADMSVMCPSNRKLVCDNNKKRLYMEDLVKLETTTVTDRPVYLGTQNQNQIYSIPDRGNDKRRNNGTSLGAQTFHIQLQILGQVVAVLLATMCWQ